MKRLLPLLLALAGCGVLPRDTEGTLRRIEASRTVRVGVIADARADPRAVADLARRIARTAGARATLTPGATEPLLAALDQDQLDLVIGAFARDTPWRDRVTLAPPVARYDVGTQRLLVRAAVRNGENRWAMLVEHAAREQAPALADES